MSETRIIKGIKVESCITPAGECPKYRVGEKYCPEALKPWDGKSIPPTCPLPAWPSISDNKLYFIAHRLSQKADRKDDWREWKKAIAEEFKSIGVEIVEESDD